MERGGLDYAHLAIIPAAAAFAWALVLLPAVLLLR